MGGYIKDIKAIASDGVKIIAILGTQEVQQSLDKIREISKIATEIGDSLNGPEMVKNMEDIRFMRESMQNTATKMENTMLELNKTGITDEAKEVIKSVRNAMNLDGNVGNLSEMTVTIKNMVRSIRELVDELKLAVAFSKKYDTIHNIMNSKSNIKHHDNIKDKNN